MASKVIDKFTISIRTPPNKDYIADISVIKLPYIINVGDMLFEINYKNRGIRWYRSMVLDVTDEHLVINEEDKTFYLPWEHEPNYCDIFDGRLCPNPEPRSLEIRPFPRFCSGFLKGDLLKVKDWDDSVFIKNVDIDYGLYVRNFENIIGRQTTMF